MPSTVDFQPAPKTYPVPEFFRNTRRRDSGEWLYIACLRCGVVKDASGETVWDAARNEPLYRFYGGGGVASGNTPGRYSSQYEQSIIRWRDRHIDRHNQQDEASDRAARNEAIVEWLVAERRWIMRAGEREIVWASI